MPKKTTNIAKPSQKIWGWNALLSYLQSEYDLKISESTLLRWHNEIPLVCKKLSSRKIFFEIDDIKHWLVKIRRTKTTKKEK